MTAALPWAMAGARPHGPAGAPRRAGPLGIAAAAAAQRAPPPAPAGRGPPAIRRRAGPGGSRLPRPCRAVPCRAAPHTERPAGAGPAAGGAGGRRGCRAGAAVRERPPPRPRCPRTHARQRPAPPRPASYLGAADTPCPAQAAGPRWFCADPPASPCGSILWYWPLTVPTTQGVSRTSKTACSGAILSQFIQRASKP
ncbi:uncharacterized protein [Taeniopygia guttata]|uniref:uncharacterized protein isoform X2 n=1 Tax=Taeniopygia guttata TaxID=59729 RepID=UPI003BB95A80